MEYLLGAALCFGLPLWLILRSIAAARQQRAMAEYAWSLVNWEESEDGWSWRLNFPEMRLYRKYRSREWPPTADSDDVLQVRRNEAGACWEGLIDGQWRTLTQAHQAPIETAYQRYIRRS